MANYKYPYIPHEYYAAVMFACKMIKEKGYKNKAISTAASYYGVDEDEVRKHVEARAAAGQRGKKSPAAGKKYKYFIVGEFYGNDANGLNKNPSSIRICKGLTKDTVERRFTDADFEFDKRNDYGGSYAPYRLHSVLGEYQTLAEAEQAAKKIKVGQSK